MTRAKPHGMVRSARVMVRFAPGSAVAPDEICFTPEEKRLVEQAAGRAKYRHLSTFIREVATEAAMMTVARADGPQVLDDFQLVKTAANSCGLPLGEWVRMVVMAGIGELPLVEHMAAAVDFMARVSQN